MDNLIYYPYINMPKSAWSVRAFLYYEKIGSIVPQSFFYDKSKLDPFMRDLVDHKIVEPINPIEVFKNPWEMSRPFINYLEDLNYDLKWRQISFRNGRITKLHPDKFDGDFFYRLQQIGLAARENDEWYVVEQNTANELMLYLASIVGNKLEYRPATDNYRPEFSVSGRLLRDHILNQRRKTRRENILEELLPFPEEIDIMKIKKFKDKYLKELRAFRNKVELIVLDDKLEEETDFYKEKIKELKLSKDELSARMNESKLGKLFFGTVCGMAGAGISMATVGNMSGFVAGIPGFANAIYSAMQIEGDNNIYDQSGMKYLALVDKKLR